MKIPALLAGLRRRGEPVALTELARRVVAAPADLDRTLARRVVAEVLDWDVAEIPDVLHPDQLRRPEARRVAAIPIEDADFAVVDLETTGLSADGCDILEIGAARVRRLSVEDEFETFARPQTSIPERITRLTGIRDDMVEDAPELPEALACFRAWLSETPRAPFVAHNAGFDERFVSAGLRRCGFPPLGVPVLCTRRLGRRLAPEVERYGLDALSAHFGLSNTARHRALGDARVTAHLLAELLSRAPGHGLETLGDLIDFQQDPPARKSRRRPRRR